MSTVDRDEAVQIATLCVECGVPHLAPGFLGAGLSLDEVKTRVSTVGAVQSLVATAGRCAPHLDFAFAMTMLTEGGTIPQIRTAIFDAIVAEQSKTEIASHIPMEVSGAARSSASMARTLKTMGITPVGENGA